MGAGFFFPFNVRQPFSLGCVPCSGVSVSVGNTCCGLDLGLRLMDLYFSGSSLQFLEVCILVCLPR